MGLLQNLTGWHALILLAVVLLFFGATKLPGLAKSVGQSMKIFKTELKDAQGESVEAATGTPAEPSAATKPFAGADTAAALPVAPRPSAVGSEGR
ncbi:MAG: Sec-independent protein translocase TatA [Herbiconiux sp.]|uniref:twin-arginine translocase TatA/TatE family subunit n=1 Tax=Herbiconiux sp. TaxID=1871186 RepID=UPI0012151D4F|nr:twin-arginine translocase TatA/TatE family subunit [Herbiconiux sp.]TAJ46654.1 MAG: Sec-independent protein translocase TatA [Herbiconiux sp.]